MKNYSRKEFERILIDNGYVLARQNAHNIWQKGNLPNIAVPAHKLNFMICKRLIKENKLQIN